MIDEFDGADLLDTARELVRGPLLDALPEHLRTTALMVANAMAITSRQLHARDVPLQAELLSLQQIFDAPHSSSSGAMSGLPLSDRIDRIKVLNRTLVDAIRNGEADAGMPMSAQIHAHLRRVTQDRLMVTNPRYLLQTDKP